MRPRMSIATLYYQATGQELSIVNQGRIDFTIAVQVPGMGIQTWQSRWNADGSMTFLGSTLS